MSSVSWHDLFNFSDYGQLVPLVHNALIAGAVLGLLGGVIGVLVITRDLPFAVHGISELSFAGAAGALLFGGSVVVGSLAGSVLAALVIGLLGNQARNRNSSIGVLMPFGLGLGILFLSLYQGRATNKFGLLTGQIVAVDSTNLRVLIGTAVVVLTVLTVIWRPLMFASVDTEVAAARGVPIRLLGPLFMVLLGCVVALSVQVVGALLVLALLVTPAAAALRVTAAPVLVVVLSVGFAMTATVGGIFVALGTDIPISPYVTTISFLIYLGCRVVERVRGRLAGPARGSELAPGSTVGLALQQTTGQEQR